MTFENNDTSFDSTSISYEKVEPVNTTRSLAVFGFISLIVVLLDNHY